MNAFIQILIPTTELNSHKKILEMKSLRLMRNVCIIYHNHFSISKISIFLYRSDEIFTSLKNYLLFLYWYSYADNL